MANKLYRVPFTYTLTAIALVVAKDVDAATEYVTENHVFDETNLDESNVFWEQGAMILKSDVKNGDPVVDNAIEVIDPAEIKDLCDAYEINLDDDGEDDLEDEDEAEDDEPLAEDPKTTLERG